MFALITTFNTSECDKINANNVLVDDAQLSIQYLKKMPVETTP
jgi:hypothetical protein